jgi:hypothetical protein
MVDVVEGNHYRLPLSTTFLNPWSSPDPAIHLRADACKSSAGGDDPAECTYCSFFRMNRVR